MANKNENHEMDTVRMNEIVYNTIQIENLMGRYVAPQSGKNFANSVLELFDLNNPAVSIRVDNEEFKGSEAVSKYWHTLQKVQEKNGNVLGQHMLTSPYVTISENKQNAYGMWQDVGTTLCGPGMGQNVFEAKEKYSAVREVSRYEVRFHKTDAGWKILNLSWIILWRYPGISIDENSGWIADTSAALPSPPKYPFS